MKKITLLLLLVLSAVGANAQQFVNFKIGYKPETTYKQTTVQSTKAEISYGGGMEPMVNEGKTTSATTIVTGKPVKGIYPFTLQMDFDKETQAAANMPEGTKLYGKIMPEGKLEVDSIQAPGMNEQMKDVLKGSMKAAAEQNLLAEKKIKVGESHVVTTPLDLPMGPVTAHLDTKTTYKLKKIEGRKAYFDVDQVITMNSNIEGQDVKANGSGTGQMVYDIDQNFPVEYNNTTSMSLAFSAQGMDMNLKITSIQSQTSIISQTKK
jgi:hypothetical protein